MNWVIFIKMKLIIKPINISFKPLEKQDIDDVLAIECLAYSAPWNKAKFVGSLGNKQTLAVLILLKGKIIGYAIALRSIDSADLLNLCIHPKNQHQGLGSQLFLNLVTQLKEFDIDSVILEVRQSNKAARSFYQKNGFELIDTRKKYYADGEDAKILCFQINK